MQKRDIHNLAKALYEASRDKKGVEFQHVLDRAAAVLQEKKLLKHLNAFFSALERIHNDEESIRNVTVTSARPLSTTERSELKKYFAEHFKAQHIELEEKVDPAVLGGFIAESDNDVINASLKQSLQDLVKHLKTE